MRSGEYARHNRGRRTGHVLKGVTQEPGIAKYPLVEKERYQEIHPNGKIPALKRKARVTGIG